MTHAQRRLLLAINPDAGSWSDLAPMPHLVAQRSSLAMTYYWLKRAMNELSPAMRAEAARRLHAFIIDLSERADAA
jgi:hypothetical protein